MAKQPAAMNVIGQLSPETVQFSAMRNNRIMQAIQEQSAMERTQAEQAGATKRAALQEQGASSRAAMETGGANQRAVLAEKGAGVRTQADVAMREKELASNDARSAAEIRARRESDEFNKSWNAEQKRIDREREDARFNKMEAIAREDKKEADGWRKKESDLNFAWNMAEFSRTQQNTDMMIGTVQKLAGAEEANERLITVRREMSRKFEAKTMTFSAIDKQIDSVLGERFKLVQGDSVSGQIDKAFQDVTTAMQVPVSLELFKPENRDKLEQTAAGWDVAQSYAVRKSIEKMRDNLASAKEQAGQGKLLQWGSLADANRKGFLKGSEPMIKRLDDALTVLDGDLPRSTRTLPNSPMTLGKQVSAYKMAHDGLTSEAVAYLGEQLYPDDNDGFRKAIQSLYRQPLTADHPLIPEKLRATASPEAIEMYNAIWDSVGQAVPGLRQSSPGVASPTWFPGRSTGADMTDVPLDLTKSESRLAYMNEAQRRSRGNPRTGD